MQPIILLAALAVGGGLISTGFLAGSNEFEIWIQDLGFAEGEIESPLEHANVDFEVTKTPVDPDDIPNTGDEFFKNEITDCSFHTFENLDDGGDLICKLFSWDLEGERVVVCEGRVTVGGSETGDPKAPYYPSDTFLIPIEQEAYVGACDVQNIDFVKIVATGEEPLSAFCDLTTHVILGGDGDDMFEPWGANGVNNQGGVDDEQCVPNFCGDGFVNQASEVCDDGNNVPSDGCSATCDSNETCGNNVIDVTEGETCDDGDNVPGDGCDEVCQLEGT